LKQIDVLLERQDFFDSLVKIYSTVGICETSGKLQTKAYGNGIVCNVPRPRVSSVINDKQVW